LNSRNLKILKQIEEKKKNKKIIEIVNDL